MSAILQGISLVHVHLVSLSLTVEFRIYNVIHLYGAIQGCMIFNKPKEKPRKEQKYIVLIQYNFFMLGRPYMKQNIQILKVDLNKSPDKIYNIGLSVDNVERCRFRSD